MSVSQGDGHCFGKCFLVLIRELAVLHSVLFGCGYLASTFALSWVASPRVSVPQSLHLELSQSVRFLLTVWSLRWNPILLFLEWKEVKPEVG